MYLLLAIFALQLVKTVPASVIFEDCGSAYELQEVNIFGCGWSLPCYVTLGENVPVQVRFFADFSSTLLDQNVVININLISLSTDVTPDPCVTVDCPVRTDAINSFVSVMSVPSRMALNQRGYLRWRVYNERNRVVLCYSVMVQTQSRTQKALRQILSKVTPVHANEIVDKIHVESASTKLDENYIQKLINTYYDSRSQDLMTADDKTSEDSTSDGKISHDPIFDDIRSHNPLLEVKKNQGPTLEDKNNENLFTSKN